MNVTDFKPYLLRLFAITCSFNACYTMVVLFCATLCKFGTLEVLTDVALKRGFLRFVLDLLIAVAPCMNYDNLFIYSAG